MTRKSTFYEFFAGGGMARAGLGPNWQCVFANDFSKMKAHTYASNWSSDHLICSDVADIKLTDLTGQADLVWASFPCQDLSLAGNCRGMGDAASELRTRSGTFWPFWSLMSALKEESRAPRLIVLENVTGALTSRDGEDFRALCRALSDAQYRYGAVVIDAKDFVPQSRQRVFFVAVANDVTLPDELTRSTSSKTWHTTALCNAQARLDKPSKKQWVWWHLPRPAIRNIGLANILEDHPTGCRWHSIEETQRILAMMSPLNLAKIQEVRESGVRKVGTVYKRTRPNAKGVRQQRAEVRFDDVAGCLRTPAGGSSRQIILVVEGEQVRSRLISAREAARLMGLEDSYRLPDRYNDAYYVAGDGVCVPVVRFLSANLLEPILSGAVTNSRLIAA
jgi:DNA (cytosine-5)-methyltransferase 1